MTDSLTTRRRARALALQILFGLDDGVDPGVVGDAVATWGDRFELEVDVDSLALAKTLVEAAAADDDRRGRIDEVIAAGSRNWRLERMARVDRNILRLAVGELLHTPATPVRVVINEAVELAKRFGTAESSAFVNGVLDRIAANLGRRDEGGPAAATP
ncbi:MAG: transcription antitermination factor NusB [Kofleriaceae bacterium]